MSPAEPDSAPDLTATYAIVQRICTELERTALLADRSSARRSA